MSKLSFFAGVGVGYVLGTRAGRHRFEQIKSGAQSVWKNPKVQDAVSHAQDVAAQKAPEVSHRIAETATAAAHKVGDKVGEKVGGSSSNQNGSGSGEDVPPGFVDNPAKGPQ